MSLNSNQCHKLLGLREGASIGEIKNAYRRLALEYHPDKNISAKDGVKFRIITEAYNTLRIKNNVHVISNTRTEYQPKNENQQYKKNNFPDWLDWFYSKMDHNYATYAKNIHRYYQKYEPLVIEYSNKLERKIHCYYQKYEPSVIEYSNKIERKIHRYYQKYEPSVIEYSKKIERNASILINRSIRFMHSRTSTI